MNPALVLLRDAQNLNLKILEYAFENRIFVELKRDINIQTLLGQGLLYSQRGRKFFR